MHQNLADQMKTQTHTFIIGRVDLARHSRVPRRRRLPALTSAFIVIESEKGSELDIMLGEGSSKMKQNWLAYLFH